VSPSTLGKILLVAAAVCAVAGVLALALGAAGLKLGRLPGDVTFRRGGTRVSIPIVTSLALSVILTVVLNVLLRVIVRR